MKKLSYTVALIGGLMSSTAMAQDLEAFRDAVTSGNATWEDIEARAKEEGVVNLYY